MKKSFSLSLPAPVTRATGTVGRAFRNAKIRRSQSGTSKLLSFFGITSFVLAATLIILMIIMNIEKVRIRYEQYLVVFEDLENKVASLNNKWLILIVIILLFILRANSWIYPLTIVYFSSALVFTPTHSFIINMGGTLMIAAFRYYTGMQMGEGMWNKIIRRHPTLNGIFEARGKHNPYTLFVLRFVPFIPFNTVSHVYGSFDFPFWKFMLITLIARAPQLLTYSFIGNNVYDPLSTKFYLPIAFLLVLTGISLFTLRGIISFIPKKVNTKDANTGHGAHAQITGE